MDWPASLSHWLQSHNIDPERISVVLQTNDERVKAAVEAAFERDLSKEFLTPPRSVLTRSVLKYCGLAIEIRALPELLRRLARNI